MRSDQTESHLSEVNGHFDGGKGRFMKKIVEVPKRERALVLPTDSSDDGVFRGFSKR